jgi:hypothetical protein
LGDFGEGVLPVRSTTSLLSDDRLRLRSLLEAAAPSR